MKVHIKYFAVAVSVSALCVTNAARADSKKGQAFVALWCGATSCSQYCDLEEQLLGVAIPVPFIGSLSPAFGDVEIKLTIYGDMRSSSGFIHIDVGDQRTRLTPDLSGVITGSTVCLTSS